MFYDNNYSTFIIPILVLLVTRIIKFVTFYFRHGKNFEYTKKHAMSYGHMPSVHTALMTSMVTSVGYYTGVTSGAFAVSVVMAIIVVDDATRLRVYMGRHSEYINLLKEKINLSIEEYPDLKERMGHRVSEVIAGAIIGFIFTVFFIILFGIL